MVHRTKNHSCGVFKKGDEFVIHNLLTSKCCKEQTFIDIGKKSRYSFCINCGRAVDTNPGCWWFHDFCFAPIEEAGDYSIEELLEQIEEVLEKDLVEEFV
jgi:NMD protein affecting ribosome stability and mRNA decay